MVGSLKFNSGFGIKKIDKILAKYPDILNFKTQMVDHITDIDGFMLKQPHNLDNLDKFKEFLGKIKLEIYCRKVRSR